MHSVVHVNLHCRVASSHLHRPRANVERDVHFKKELDFLIYMRRLAAGVKPCTSFSEVSFVRPGYTGIGQHTPRRTWDIRRTSFHILALSPSPTSNGRQLPSTMKEASNRHDHIGIAERKLSALQGHAPLCLLHPLSSLWRLLCSV